MRARLLLLAVFCACISAIRPVPAHAAGQLALTVSPVRIEIDVAPGQEVTRAVEITNASSSTVGLSASAVDFEAAGDSGKPRFVRAGRSEWSMSGWVRSAPNQFTLGAGETRKIEVGMRVPKDAEPGGRYAAVLFSSAPLPGAKTAIVASVGTLVLLRVTGRTTEAGSATLDAPRLVDGPPVNFGVRFANDGNVHVKPAGSVKVSRLWGGPVANLRIGGENVLPHSARAFQASWKDVPAFGAFVAEGALSYGTAGKNAPLGRTIFFVLPWRLLLAGIALFALGILVSLLVRRKPRVQE